MKSFKYISIFAIALFVVAGAAYASTFNVNPAFAGRVVSTVVPSVTCSSGTGPVTITGRHAPTMQVIFPYSARRYGRYNVRPFGTVIGRYSTSVDTSSCYTQTPAGPVPYPVMRVIFYQASGPDGILRLRI